MRKRGSYGPETRFRLYWPRFRFGKRGSTAGNAFHGRTGHVSVSGNVAVRPETRFTAVPNAFPRFVPVSVRKRTSIPRFLQHRKQSILAGNV